MDSPTSMNVQTSRVTILNSPSQENNPLCYVCKQRGHFSNHCRYTEISWENNFQPTKAPMYTIKQRKDWLDGDGKEPFMDDKGTQTNIGYKCNLMATEDQRVKDDEEMDVEGEGGARNNPRRR